MKRLLRIVFPLLTLALTMSMIFVFRGKATDARHTVTCTRLKIEVLDSAKLGFVTRGDVKAAIDREYGVYIGQRIDSVNTGKIEKILEGQSAVMGSRAFVTGDGVLHVQVWQREPVLRFETERGGYYADGKGYIFPLQSHYKSQVRVISGNVPLKVPDGYRGQATSAKERKWLSGAIELDRILGEERIWRGGVGKISVDGNGDIVLKMTQGKEKFIFGKPSDIEEKLRKMEDYYKYIAPSKEEGWYSTVNVKYAGQTICRR